MDIGKINSKEFKDLCRLGKESYFTRNRKMPLHDLLLTMINRKGLTLTLELRNYMKTAHPGISISKPGYLKQRMKLNPDAFLELYKYHNRNLYSEPGFLTYNGHLILAADGSDINIPTTDETLNLYGTASRKNIKAQAQIGLGCIYDVMNRMASMKERTGQTVSYEYDTEGNLSAERRSEGISALYTYDALNRITSLENIREKKTASVLKSSARTEDAEGSAGGDGDSGEDEKEEEKKDIISGFYYTYDKSGRMVKEEATDPLGSLIKDYTYNDAGKLTEYKESRGEEVLLTTAYTYDTFGNKTEELITSKKGSIRQISYTYDSADRLSVKKENGRTTASYAYDRDGNLIRKNESGKETVYTYTTDNRLATTTVNGVLESSVVYDGNGLKTFELLRKEYDRDVTKEEILLIRENEAALKKWKKYYK